MDEKIVIIGAGFVGATSAYAIINFGLASEIVLVDINKEKAEGEAMDLNHGAAFTKPVRVSSGDYSDCQNADMIIITAGASQKSGETRLDLAKKNAEIFKDIVPQIMKYNQDTFLLVVTNPVDVLTYVTYKISNLKPNQVIGSGTVLDTSRFRYLLSRHCHINPGNVHAYIIGEHGDHEVPAWSLTNIAGVNFEEYCKICGDKSNTKEFQEKLAEEVKNAAYKIIDKKGATYYAIGLAVARITESLFRDENSILTVSSCLNGEYDYHDIALSLPCIIGSNGLEQVLPLQLNSREQKELNEAAKVLYDVTSDLNL